MRLLVLVRCVTGVVGTVVAVVVVVVSVLTWLVVWGAGARWLALALVLVARLVVGRMRCRRRDATKGAGERRLTLCATISDLSMAFKAYIFFVVRSATNRTRPNVPDPKTGPHSCRSASWMLGGVVGLPGSSSVKDSSCGPPGDPPVVIAVCVRKSMLLLLLLLPAAAAVIIICCLMLSMAAWK